MIRTVLVWAILRGLSVFGAALIFGGSGGAVLGSLRVVLLVDAVVVAAMFIDMMRRSELVFLANIGCSFRDIAVAVVAICILLEAALRVTVG